MKSTQQYDFGEEVKTILNKNGQSQTWLAEQLNISKSQLQATLKRKILDITLMTNLSELLNYDFIESYQKYRKVKSKDHGTELSNENTIVDSDEPEITISIKLKRGAETNVINKRVYEKLIEILK